MDRSSDEKINPITLIVIFVEIIFIAIIAITIVSVIKGKQQKNEINENIESNNYSVNITNFRQIVKNIGKNNIENIYFSLDDVIWLNSGYRANKKYDAAIVQDSFSQIYDEKAKIWKLDFLVNIAGFDDAFKIAYYYSNDAYSQILGGNSLSIVYCVNGSEKCIDRYAGKAERVIEKIDSQLER